MPNLLTRLVAFVLAGCLIADPATVLAFQSAPTTTTRVSLRTDLFRQQALIPFDVPFMRQPMAKMPIFTRRWVRPLHRFKRTWPRIRGSAPNVLRWVTVPAAALGAALYQTAATATAAATTAAVNTVNTITMLPLEYTIRSGDSLSKLAKTFGLENWQVLHDANRYISDPNVIHIGKKLLIPGQVPSLPVSSVPIDSIGALVPVPDSLIAAVDPSFLSQIPYAIAQTFSSAIQNPQFWLVGMLVIGLVFVGRARKQSVGLWAAMVINIKAWLNRKPIPAGPTSDSDKTLKLSEIPAAPPLPASVTLAPAQAPAQELRLHLAEPGTYDEAIVPLPKPELSEPSGRLRLTFADEDGPRLRLATPEEARDAEHLAPVTAPSPEKSSKLRLTLAKEKRVPSANAKPRLPRLVDKNGHSYQLTALRSQWRKMQFGRIYKNHALAQTAYRDFVRHLPAESQVQGRPQWTAFVRDVKAHTIQRVAVGQGYTFAIPKPPRAVKQTAQKPVVQPAAAAAAPAPVIEPAVVSFLQTALNPVANIPPVQSATEPDFILTPPTEKPWTLVNPVLQEVKRDVAQQLVLELSGDALVENTQLPMPLAYVGLDPTSEPKQRKPIIFPTLAQPISPAPVTTTAEDFTKVPGFKLIQRARAGDTAVQVYLDSINSRWKPEEKKAPIEAEATPVTALAPMAAPAESELLDGDFNTAKSWTGNASTPSQSILGFVTRFFKFRQPSLTPEEKRAKERRVLAEKMKQVLADGQSLPKPPVPVKRSGVTVQPRTPLPQTQVDKAQFIETSRAEALVQTIKTEFWRKLGQLIASLESNPSPKPVDYFTFVTQSRDLMNRGFKNRAGIQPEDLQAAEQRIAQTLETFANSEKLSVSDREILAKMRKVKPMVIVESPKPAAAMPPANEKMIKTSIAYDEHGYEMGEAATKPGIHSGTKDSLRIDLQTLSGRILNDTDPSVEKMKVYKAEVERINTVLKDLTGKGLRSEGNGLQREWSLINGELLLNYDEQIKRAYDQIKKGRELIPLSSQANKMGLYVAGVMEWDERNRKLGVYDYSPIRTLRQELQSKLPLPPSSGMGGGMSDFASGGIGRGVGALKNMMGSVRLFSFNVFLIPLVLAQGAQTALTVSSVVGALMIFGWYRNRQPDSSSPRPSALRHLATQA